MRHLIHDKFIVYSRDVNPCRAACPRAICPTASPRLWWILPFRPPLRGRTAQSQHEGPAPMAVRKTAPPPSAQAEWTFLTNHAHVLLCIAQNPQVLMRDVASRVGITERAVQRIVADLVRGGYLRRRRSGRRNHYEVRDHLPLRHPVERHRTVAALIDLVLEARHPSDRASPIAGRGKHRAPNDPTRK